MPGWDILVWTMEQQYLEEAKRPIAADMGE